jgi:esterase/lipase superfamily enzyme
LSHVLDIDTPVLLFDWPGDQGASLSGYRSARRVATASGAELAAALDLVLEQAGPERVWIIANSLGGQVVVDAFHQLAAETPTMPTAEPRSKTSCSPRRTWTGASSTSASAAR